MPAAPDADSSARTPGASAPMVVSSPWPVCTTVSPASGSRRSRMRAQDRGPVGERAPGGTGTAVEQRVAGEQHLVAGVVEAAAAWAVAGRVEHHQVDAAGRDDVAIVEGSVVRTIGVHDVPQHRVVGVQEDRRVDGLGERDGGVDVVVVPVRADDRHDAAAVHALDDRRVVVGGVDHEHLVVVADQPDVVVDVEVLAVDRERATGDDPVQAGHHEPPTTTTERSTSPRSIRWNASSTPSSGMVSLTKRSRSSRPWR